MVEDAKILTKGLNLLDEIAKSSEGISANDLAERIGTHRTSVYRYLNALLQSGYVRKDGEGRFRLGNKILELSSQLLRQIPLREAAHPFLVALSNSTQKTVHLCVLDHVDVVYIDKVESQRTLPIMSRIGSRAPAYCTSVGKALLSALPMEQLTRLLGDIDFRKRTKNTITDPMRFLEEIHQVQDQRYAVDNQEHEEGVVCFATLVRQYGGEAVGSISVTGLSRDYQDEEKRSQFLEALMSAAREISCALGFVE